jgi:hypothetical protein
MLGFSLSGWAFFIGSSFEWHLHFEKFYLVIYYIWKEWKAKMMG